MGADEKNKKQFEKAVIFDMDGVISDTQELHAQVQSDILKNYGVEMAPEEISEKYAGFKDRDFFWAVLEQYSLTDFVEDAVQRKNTLFYEGNIPIEPISGVVDLIKKIHKAGIGLGVASGSPQKFVDKVVEKLEIRDYFGVVLSSDQVAKGKPAPDVFLKVAEILQVAPEVCTVIEDGKNGMIGAKVAGMKCIGLVPDLAQPLDYPADCLVQNLSDVDITFF